MNVPSGLYLASLLAPLAGMLGRADVTDIYINRPGELWAETLGGAVERLDVPELTDTMLQRLARQIAALSHQGISREHPLLSATLPDGARVQIVAPPATRGHMAIAIRKHVTSKLRLEDYTSSGAFERTHRRSVSASSHDLREKIGASVDDGDEAEVLRQMVRQRKTILVSGGTSTGKTTFLNALIAEVPAEERLILIEDTPELQIGQPNSVGLLAARSDLGEARVTANDLVAAALRMRPDRIILGELRGDEAYAFLRAVNTGHPGSMTTVHADSPAGAVEQIALLILQGGTRLNRRDVIDYVRSIVGAYVQLARDAGRRYVSEVVLSK